MLGYLGRDENLVRWYRSAKRERCQGVQPNRHMIGETENANRVGLPTPTIQYRKSIRKIWNPFFAQDTSTTLGKYLI